jgi:SNF2 family DNA or RNA helicase
MTGTPVQNSLDDLSSLIRFLRVPRLEDPLTFQKHISGRRTAVGIRRPNYTNLKLLLGSICLRRSTAAILSSLGVTFVEHRPQFSAAERKAYDELALSFERSIKAAVNSRSSRKSSKSILTAMLRLRIFCNTGTVPGNLDDDIEDNFRDDELTSLQIQSGEAVCSRCNTEIVTPDLGSEFQRNKGSRRLLKCLVCSQQDIQDFNTAESASDPTFGGDPMEGVEGGGQVTPIPTSDAIKQGENSSAYPSKLMALLKDIKEHYSEDKR